VGAYPDKSSERGRRAASNGVYRVASCYPGGQAGRWGELISSRIESDGIYLTVTYREISAQDGSIISAYRARRLSKKAVVWTSSD
jgi:hypothetical protein